MFVHGMMNQPQVISPTTIGIHPRSTRNHQHGRIFRIGSTNSIENLQCSHSIRDHYHAKAIKPGLGISGKGGTFFPGETDEFDGGMGLKAVEKAEYEVAWDAVDGFNVSFEEGLDEGVSDVSHVSLCFVVI